MVEIDVGPLVINEKIEYWVGFTIKATGVLTPLTYPCPCMTF